MWYTFFIDEAAHAANPAHRKVEPLASYLAHCAPLTRTNVYGLLNLSVEGATLHRACATAVHMVVCKYFARILF